jgi:hypothetical protein
MDADTRACVVFRIAGHTAVRYLVLFDPGERGKRRVVPQRLFCVTRPIWRVLAERGEAEGIFHVRHPEAKMMAWKSQAGQAPKVPAASLERGHWNGAGRHGNLAARRKVERCGT